MFSLLELKNNGSIFIYSQTHSYIGQISIIQFMNRNYRNIVFLVESIVQRLTPPPPRFVALPKYANIQCVFITSQKLRSLYRITQVFEYSHLIYRKPFDYSYILISYIFVKLGHKLYSLLQIRWPPDKIFVPSFQNSVDPLIYIYVCVESISIFSHQAMLGSSLLQIC